MLRVSLRSYFFSSFPLRRSFPIIWLCFLAPSHACLGIAWLLFPFVLVAVQFITVEDVGGVKPWHLTPKVLSVLRALTGTMKEHYVER